MHRKSNAEFNEAMRRRTFAFAVNTLKYLKGVEDKVPRVVVYQLSKSATSVGANFRVFCRGRSANEKYSKICIVVEESDESCYWLELIKASGFDASDTLKCLSDEADEILRIMGSIKHGFER
jgi:four helix bundle protein